MELTFNEQRIPYLAERRWDDLRQELTGEIAVPETLPPLGRIVDCFGTVLVQDRTVESGSVTVTGGVQVGVLYVPEGEGTPERLDLLLPFTLTKKTPTEEGAVLFFWGWLRSLEARFINARKLLVRGSLGGELTLLTPTELVLAKLEPCPRGLACRTETYPMRLPVCAAEAEVQLADEVLMPQEGPGADRLLKTLCAVDLGERRVLGDKAVFKGELRLRCLFADEAGDLHTWEGSLPFSQYAELDRPMEDDAHVSIQPLLRHMEIDTDGQPDSRRLLVNVGFVAQVTLWAQVPVTLTQDAYCLEGDLEPQWQTCDLGACLDASETQRDEAVDLPREAAELVDWTLFPDRTPAAPGSETAQAGLGVQVVYYDEDHRLQGRLLRRELRLERRAEKSTDWRCALRPAPGARQQGNQLLVPLTLAERYCQTAVWRNLAGGTLTPRPGTGGPSLVILRAQGPLWDIARDRGSTVRAIQEANDLTGETLPEARLLLIPTGRGLITMEEDGE